MIARRWLAVGAISGFIAVAVGAFGAHGLKQVQPPIPPERLLAFDTGVRYQMYHALAIVLCALIADRVSKKWAGLASAWFAIGTVLFSFSLYALVLLDEKKLGIITPFGGLAFLVGWACLVAAALWPDAPEPASISHPAR